MLLSRAELLLLLLLVVVAVAVVVAAGAAFRLLLVIVVEPLVNRFNPIPPNNPLRRTHHRLQVRLCQTRPW
jgi:hypothetical protein